MEFSPRPGPILLIGLALTAWASSCPALADDQGAATSAASPEERAFHDQVVPLLNRFCVKCHGPDEVKGNVDFARYGDVEAVRRDRKTWEKVIENVEAGIMPPEGDMPAEEEVARLVGWVQATLSKDGCDIENPGRVTLRRLNRAEYNNTVRDLLGVDFRPADNFPVDDVGYGFDNIGDVLTVQPLLMEKYLDAAEAVAAKAIVVPEPNPGATRSRAGKDLEGGDPYGDGGRILASTGETGAGLELSEAGDYRVRVRAFGQQAGDEPVKISVRLDGREIGAFDVRGEEGDAETFEVATRLEPGDRRVTVAFLNDFYDPENADASRRDRNLVVESLQVVGPSGPPLWPIAERDARRLDGGNRERGRRTLGSSGEITARVEFPAAGRYHLVVRASGDQAGPEPVKMGVRVDGKDVATVDVTAAEGEPGRYEVAAEVANGEHQIALVFLNDYYKPEAEDPKDRGDRNLHVAGLEVLGPTPGSLPEFHRSILDRTPGDGGDWRGAAREILRPFMNRAYRRPARDDEVERMVALAELPRKDGEPFERGIQLAVTAVLVDPHFLYRVEVDRRGIPEGTSPGAIRPLDDWELASRLSYFLWSSMPDEELFRLAGEGKLQDDAVLEAQARRMLADPKSKALVENFATQWLTLRAVWNINPDPRRFKGFDNKLREAMIRETELFFESVMREDRSVLDLLDADYTFLNESLAKHYGVEGVSGDEFRRVDLPPDSPRGGVLTQASILTITSNPTRTSPVKRGKWILEQILGTPPPPPPPDVPELKEGRQATGTLRQRMEQHRSNPSCASCHAKMDPLGFGFENFDAVGRWRDEERGDKIDPSGVLPTGESFAGIEELKGMLVRERAGQFTRNLAEKMLTFALGRGLEYYDACAVDTIAERAAADGHKFSRLVVEIVKSDPFRKRSREEGVER